MLHIWFSALIFTPDHNVFLYFVVYNRIKGNFYCTYDVISVSQKRTTNTLQYHTTGDTPPPPLQATPPSSYRYIPSSYTYIRAMINILDFCQFINETLTNFPMLKKHHSTPYPNPKKQYKLSFFVHYYLFLYLRFVIGVIIVFINKTISNEAIQLL